MEAEVDVSRCVRKRPTDIITSIHYKLFRSDKRLFLFYFFGLFIFNARPSTTSIQFYDQIYMIREIVLVLWDTFIEYTYTHMDWFMVHTVTIDDRHMS